jgi:hypothetical protein
MIIMARILPEAVYRKKGTVVARQIAGEFFLVPIRGNTADLDSVFVLDGIGDCVWQQLDGRKTVCNIRDELLKEFDAAPETLEKDLNTFLVSLSEAGLLEQVA